jgi:C1A family cysteine protease
MAVIRNFGWKPDVPDPIRDLKFSQVAKKVRVFDADRPIDLRPGCSVVEQQGDLSSCVSHGCVGLCEFLEIKDGSNFKDLSRLFVYWWARYLDNCQDTDDGAQIRDGFKSLAKYGVCVEDLWQYIEDNVNVKPPDNAIEEAKPHIISQYARLNTLDDMINCLVDGYPFVFGLSLYESFDNVASDGLVPMPSEREEPTGGHCMMCVGWLPDKGQFIVRNSWGVDFAEKGYCYIPKDYMDPANDFCDDLWTARKFSF